MELDEEYNELEARFVADSIQFITTLTELHGNEKGMELWNKFGDVLGADLQGKVFFAMLTGSNVGTLKFRSDYSVEAVRAIKCIREFTGFGLKEAKDKYDASKVAVTEVKCIDRKFTHDFASSLRALGCRVW